MSFDKGFDFRSTQGFISTTGDLDDGVTNCTWVVSDVYPVTRNGVTFGWLPAGPSAVNRDSGVDPRFAGVNYVTTDPIEFREFRVDLPATGQYTVRVAIGDTGAAQTAQAWALYDDTTLLTSFYDGDGTAQDHYDDATGVDQSEANWPSLNSGVLVTFTTTILRMRLGDHTTDGSASTIAHLFVSQVAAAAAAPTGVMMIS